VRLPPPDQTAATYDVWWQQTKTWIERRDADLATRPFADRSAYEEPSLQWAQRNFVQPQVMVHDRYLYDTTTNQWTVDRYLDDLLERYGGIDSVLLWTGYTNLGADERNAFDIFRNLPGGLAGVRQMVARFHARGVAVLWPNFPWDLGTRDEGRAQHDALVDLVISTASDGINGDTHDCLNTSWWEASLARGKALNLEPQSMGNRYDRTGWQSINYNVNSWGEGWYRGDGQFAPLVSAYKLIDSRHLPSLCNRHGVNKTNEIQTAFFNGAGYESWESIWGMYNMITPYHSEALRRTASILRQFGDMTSRGTFLPHRPVTVRHGVYASEFIAADAARALYLIVNRNEADTSGVQLVLGSSELGPPCSPTSRFFDVYHGVELPVDCEATFGAKLSFDIEGLGYGAVLHVQEGGQLPDAAFLESMAGMSARELRSYSDEWKPLLQWQVSDPPTPVPPKPPTGMVLIPGDTYHFVAKGLIPQGDQLPGGEGVDVQFPWEPWPRREHEHTMQLHDIYMDVFPVTNADYKAYLEATGYRPQVDQAWLQHWGPNGGAAGSYPAGYGRKPVTYVSRADASAYCGFHGKRLPHTWEWQRAAQGGDGRMFPWGGEGEPGVHFPQVSEQRSGNSPDDVDAHPAGASPFGVQDLWGNVWQMTDDYCDDHTCYTLVRGGSNYHQHHIARYYFGQPKDLTEHNTWIAMSESMDRVGTIGFRCVADAALGDNSLRASISNDPKMSVASGVARGGPAAAEAMGAGAALGGHCAEAQQLSKL
jgi:iron(II)-dependent oxidoreductase